MVESITESHITKEDWYGATGEMVEHNTELIYADENGNDWIIYIE